VLYEVGPTAFSALTAPNDRVSFKFLNAMAIGLLEGAGRANRVLARIEKTKWVRMSTQR